MNKAAHAYFQTNVSTTDQGRLLLMLYDGALKFIQQARIKMQAKDFAAKGILISKVIDIITELSSSLNLEKGGSLAENLNNLYLLCTARLLRANLKMDVESLDSVESILTGLRGAYAQIIDTPEARRAATDIAGRMQPVGSSLRKAQPVLQPAMTAVPRSRAQAMYGRAMNTNMPPITSTPTAESVPVSPLAAQANNVGQRAHVQNFDAFTPQRPAARIPGAYGKP
ncbi:MAG: flagellar export chaperone FliS [Desulfovibrio sp.]|nr:flagellar export chaperone FliS [Desulfovibrio sp.]